MLPELAKYKPVIVFDRKGEYAGPRAKDVPEDWAHYGSIYAFFGALEGRGGERIEELPLRLVENQGYIHYRKGSLAMYALRDYIGEEVVNGRIRAYLGETKFQSPPYTTSTELLSFIAPAVAALRARGLNVMGPVPPDALFTPRARAGYDAAICMYHDQALIPIKALDFDRTVNVTLGLPFVRTSPDHGTALDIAGTGRADPESLLAALRMAAEIASRRRAMAAVR